jgi:hypothetical protein
MDAGRTYTSPQSNPRKFLLNPGTYYIEIEALATTGPEPTHLMEDVVLEAKEEKTLNHTFKAGAAKLGAQTNGELVDVLLGIYTTNRQKQIGGSRTYAAPNRNPRAYTITPGTYAVRLRGQKNGKNTIKWYQFTVREGETITKMFEWSV